MVFVIDMSITTIITDHRARGTPMFDANFDVGSLDFTRKSLRKGRSVQSLKRKTSFQQNTKFAISKSEATFLVRKPVTQIQVLNALFRCPKKKKHSTK